MVSSTSPAGRRTTTASLAHLPRSAHEVESQICILTESGEVSGEVVERRIRFRAGEMSWSVSACTR
jgi:hypothetical protein